MAGSIPILKIKLPGTFNAENYKYGTILLYYYISYTFISILVLIYYYMIRLLYYYIIIGILLGYMIILL